MIRILLFSSLLVGACGNGGDKKSDAGSSYDSSGTVMEDASVPPSDGGTVDQATPIDLGITKSISTWGAKCDGTSDDWAVVQKAFADSAGSGVTLLFDCPVRATFGIDVTRTIFIESDTTVAMTGAGKLIIDDVYFPAFGIVNASNITLIDWNLEWDAIYPVDVANVTGDMYHPGDAPVQGAWNNDTLTSYLAKSRGIKFGAGAVAPWFGPTNASAQFWIQGDSSNIVVDGMNAYVPAGVGGNHYLPMLFTTLLGWSSNQSVDTTTTMTNANAALPHDLTFTNITLDGYVFGLQGAAINFTASHIRAHRYSDIQDADGGTVGGVGKWFAPPHLFYLNDNANAEFLNANIHISDVIDYGERTGVARDKGGSDTGSGYALSLKMGAVDSGVDNYTSYRPDGLLDILDCNNMKLTNVTATYDSSFTNNLYPGIRYPRAPNNGLVIQNLALTDLAKSSTQPPMAAGSGAGITESNVTLKLTSWAGTNSIVPTMGGTNQEVSLNYVESGNQTALSTGQKGTMTWQLAAQPSTVKSGSATTLTWSSKNATSCTASGGWTGAQATSGTKNVTVTSALSFTLLCTDGTDSGSVSVSVAVQ